MAHWRVLSAILATFTFKFVTISKQKVTVIKYLRLGIVRLPSSRGVGKQHCHETRDIHCDTLTWASLTCFSRPTCHCSAHRLPMPKVTEHRTMCSIALTGETGNTLSCSARLMAIKTNPSDPSAKVLYNNKQINTLSIQNTQIQHRAVLCTTC